jgi:hypothetical protein
VAERSNPFRRTKKEWIASSASLLAMTKKQQAARFAAQISPSPKLREIVARNA